MRAEGYGGGWVEFDGQFVSIGHGGVSRLVVGKGVKRIHISQLASVQIKPAGLLVNGFIQFATGGGNERQSRFGSQTPDAVSDENSVVFRRGQQAQFEELRKAVEYEIGRLHQPQQVQAPDVAGQISRMWLLVQQGAMTMQEFEQQKALLLGPPRQWPTTPGHAPGGPQPRPEWQ
jgi:hypothetical protein